MHEKYNVSQSGASTKTTLNLMQNS